MHMATENPLFAELSLRGWFSPYLAVAFAVIGMAIVGALYVFEAGRLAVLPRITLALLRMGIIAAVAFLVMRPVWVQEINGSKKRPVAIMIDTSQSMNSADPRPNMDDQWRAAIAFGLVPADRKMPSIPTSGDIPANIPENPTRIEVATAALANLRLMDRLRDVGPIDPATFDGSRSGRAANDLTWLKDLAATGPKTAIAGSTWELLDRDTTAQPSAIVVVTDGRQNDGRVSLAELAQKSRDSKVPLYIYGVGSSEFGLVQIRDAAVPDTLFVEDTVAVPVRYRVRGIKEGQAVVTLKVRSGRDPNTDQEVARSEPRRVSEGDEVSEIVAFVPTLADAERKDLEVIATVTVTGGAETVTDTISRSVRVETRKIKVLMVDYFARWDYKFLQRDLDRDRRVSARFYLIDGDKAAMKSGEPWIDSFPKTQEELNQYDLLILGDIPGTALTQTQREYIRDFVAEGGGLIHIAGRMHGEAPFVTKELDRVLPVELSSVRFPIDSPVVPTSFRPQLTPQGSRSPVLKLEDGDNENKLLWRTLPEIYWNYPVQRLRPGAEALLTHPKSLTADGKPMPLMASHYYGKGYVLFLGIDETWRWRYNEAETYFGRFWSQAVYATGVGRTVGTRLTQLSMDTTEPILGNAGQVYARLFGKDFKPLTSEKLTARLERIGGEPGTAEPPTTVELKPLPGQQGEYVATVPFNRVGRFALKVDNGDDKAQLEYRVNLPPEHEQAPGGMAEAELIKLAEETGGKFYREEDLSNLPADITPQYSPYSQKEELLLWNRWAMFLLIGLLTMEWTLRKFNSMS